MRRSIQVVLALVCLGLSPAVALAAPIPFAAQRIISTSQGFGVDVIAGDLDRDGDLDLVGSGGTNSGSGVFAYKNLDGRGTFGPAQAIGAGQLENRASIELVDMDQDGDLDLLSGDYAVCAWYPNDGQGNFGARTIVRNDYAFVEFASADVDGDGDPDVVGIRDDGGGAGSIAWFTNNGGGSFNPATEHFIDALPNGGFEGKVVPADMDGDGDIDLVVLQSISGDQVAWYRNTTGTGTFSAKQTISLMPAEAGGIAVADVDGDGDLDVVSADYGTNSVRWHENTAGDGSAWTDHTISTTDCASFFVKIADMDLDGDPDVLVATRVTNQARWIENTAGNGSTWTNRLITGNVGWPLATIAADLDGDGDLDAVTASLDDNKFAWNENRTIHRNAAFDGGVLMDTSVTEMTELRVADLNGDGDPDVVAALRSNGRLVWFDNDGTSPAAWPLRDVATGIPAFTESSDVADLDGDGDLDVAISPGGGVIHWYQNNGALLPTFTDRTLSSTLDPGIDVAAGDIDGDGDVDLVAMSYFAAAWYENNGAALPTWTERPLPGSFNNGRDLTLGDLDRDGDLDVIASDGSGTALRWYENNGASPPVWTLRSIATTVADPLSVEAADMDGDGDLDLLTPSLGDGTVDWIENQGGAPIAWTTHTIGTGFVWLSAFPADIDGDGDLDVFTGRFSATQEWFENNGGSPPQWTQHAIPATNLRQYNVIDLNGDADVDLIGVAPNNSSVYAFENLGGQYGFSGSSIATGLAYDGEVAPLLAVGVRLNGRPGDSVGRLATLDIRLESGAHVALSSAQANALFDELRVYRDDGDGVFEDGQDILVGTVGTLSLTAGVQTVALSPSDPNVSVAAPATFYVVPLMAANASAQPVNSFFATHLAVGGSMVVDASAGIALVGAATSDVGTGNAVQALPRFVVNSTSDGVDAAPGNGICATGGGACTLRAAVMESNAFPGSDRIVLGPGTYTLTIAGTGEEAAAQGDLDVTGALTIAGAGAASTILSGGGIDRLFDVRAGGDLVLDGLQLRGGFLSGAANGGGAIRTNASSTLTVRRCDLRNNQANVAGAIENNGNALIEDSLIFGNTGFQCEAFQNSAGNATLRNVTISGNSGSNAVVGLFAGTLTVEGCTISANGAEGLENFGGATFAVRNTLVAGNALGLQGAFSSQGFNLIDNVGTGTGFTNGVNNDKVGGGANPVIDAKLKALGSYGGPTFTHQLLATSPAVDAGSCGALVADQRGVKRPIDVAGVANVADGCDIGAYELESGAALSRIEVPVRWCGLRGSPSVESPALMGASNVNDLLRRRHEVASENIYTPQTGIVFGSAANYTIASYPLLEDPDCVEGPPGSFNCTRGVRGDVYIDPDVANFDEYEELIAACRAAWYAQDPTIQGITAVQINHFVDGSGAPLSILGIGGRAQEGDAREQAAAGRVAVVDSFYRQSANPADTIDRLLGHELGHAVSLRHGDGIDNDGNAIIDDNDEAVVGLPRFDGNNIMQYRAGTTLTAGQTAQARNHLLATVPDLSVQPFGDATPSNVPIDPKNARILDFGFDAVLSLANARILDFKNASILDFENNGVTDFANARILDFKNASILDFKNARILDFGMSYNGETPAGSTNLQASTAAIPWPASLRPKTRYFFYLDVDRDDGTGAYPASKINPSDAPNHFPGSSNFVTGPNVANEAGVDLIAEVELEATCAGNQCSSTSVLRIFDYDDGGGVYTQVSSTPSPNISATNVGLYVDNGGAPVDLDSAPTGITVQPTIPNSVLFAAGWGFTNPPGGGAPVPKPVRMEVVTTIGCAGNILNDGSATARNCQCSSCASCPDYPGCIGTVGTPRTLAGTSILTDDKSGELTFQPPVLPQCTVIPALAAQGQAVTVYVTQLPTGFSGTVEVSRATTVIGTASASAVSAAGTVSVAATLPSTASGQVSLSAGITGTAPRAQCLVTVTPTLACADADGDGICDSVDSDDDNDGVADGADAAPLNRLVCRDVDSDQCNDCSSGVADPLHDGADYDRDGLCDRGDPDDDNDGVLDVNDGQPFNGNACGDSDGDQCDDCVIASTPSPGNDGPDSDNDGLCDFGDHDFDGDGVLDGNDCAPQDATAKAIPIQVTGMVFGSGGVKNRVSWTAPQAQGGSATVSDLLRGTRAGLPVGSGTDTCVATGTAAAQFDDLAIPAPGIAWWYLVRAHNACGSGGYGTTSAGAARMSGACP